MTHNKSELVINIYASTAEITPKDAWDKIEIAGTIAATVLVALVGGLFTILYNNQQRRIEDRRRSEDAVAAKLREESEKKSKEEHVEREKEMELKRRQLQESDLAVRRIRAVQSLLPDLKSNVLRDRRAALLAVQALGDEDFAADLARIYGGPAGVSTLASLSFADDVVTHEARAFSLLSGLTKRLRHSVVYITTGSGGGCGFSIKPGLILTASHVIHDATQGNLHVGVESITHSWRLLGHDETNTVALLECDAWMVPLNLAAHEPEVEDDILIVGWHHNRRTWVAEPGIVLGPLQQQGASSQGVQLLMPAEIGSMPGFGGAPVVNSALEVVAMHFMKITNTNDERNRGLAFMISLPMMKGLLQSRNIEV